MRDGDHDAVRSLDHGHLRVPVGEQQAPRFLMWTSTKSSPRAALGHGHPS